MLDGLKPLLRPRLADPDSKGTTRVLIATPLAESEVAEYLTELAQRVEPKGVKVGSYPRWGKKSNTVTLVGRYVGGAFPSRCRARAAVSPRTNRETIGTRTISIALPRKLHCRSRAMWWPPRAREKEKRHMKANKERRSRDQRRSYHYYYTYCTVTLARDRGTVREQNQCARWRWRGRTHE